MFCHTASNVESATPLADRARNLVRFGRHLPGETMHEDFAGDYAFRDAGSRFSLLKNQGTDPGPDECFGLFARDARLVMRKLLGLEVHFEGLDPARQADITVYNTVAYRRSAIEEYFAHNGVEPLPPLTGTCTTWFAAADVMCIWYRLHNTGDTALRLSLRWYSLGGFGGGVHMGDEPGRAVHQIESTVTGRDYRARIEICALDGPQTFTRSGDHMIRSEWVTCVIPAGGRSDFQFQVRCAFNHEAFPVLRAEEGRSLPQALAEEEQSYARLPPLPDGAGEHLDLTLTAVGTLRSLRYRDRDPHGAMVTTIHASKTGCGATWFWDTGAMLPGLGIMGEREAGAGALRLLAGGIDAEGKPPITYEHQQHLYHGYQFPILCWGAGHFLSFCPDGQLMADLYQPFARYVRHWMTTFRDPGGLLRHPYGCSCLDDSLRWQRDGTTGDGSRPWYQTRWGPMEPGRFACPDINAFMVLELRTLAVMAGALGRADEIPLWQDQAEELAAAINDQLLDRDSGTYQDRDLVTGAFNGVVSAGSFMPIYAGIAPPAVARHSCEAYLLSPKRFLTPFPFPVIDRAHPTFRSGGRLLVAEHSPDSLVPQAYWRGRTWPHVNVWLLGALWCAGFEAEADVLADRILRMISRSEGICECYDSLSGEAIGHPEFMWSASAVLQLAHRRYRSPAVPEL